MKEESELKNYCTLTDSELVEKAEQWLQRLINTGGRDWSLPVPANPNKDVDLVIAEIIHRFKKDRPTPVVQAKTAEEILEDRLSSEYVISARAKRIAIECMHAYHAQFTPSAKSVEVKEAVREAAKAEMGVSYEPHMSQMDQSFIEGAEFGSNWQEQKQAETISRMREALEQIYKSLDDWPRNNSIFELIKLAKEALKQKEL